MLTEYDMMMGAPCAHNMNGNMATTATSKWAIFSPFQNVLTVFWPVDHIEVRKKFLLERTYFKYMT